VSARRSYRNWLNLLICIDGADGIGKSSLASWLAWQLGAVAIHLDLYVVPDRRPRQWRIDDLRRVMNARPRIRPAIVEGVLALDALEEAQRSPSFLIFVEGDSSSRQLGPEIYALARNDAGKIVSPVVRQKVMEPGKHGPPIGRPTTPAP
jgi:hypothetical protein